MEGDEKKKRKRLKETFKQIQKQMEFYFSDSNLHKDRFLRKEIDQSPDGWLNLQMFGNFNKLKAITTDMEIVARALKKSDKLQVSEDGLKVKRISPIRDAKDVDDRTVYVECLPKEADHSWVRSHFSHYGNVVYVSLPKYRSSGDIKGFAFVEFESVEDAKKVIEEINKKKCSQIDKVGKFPVKGSKDIQKLKKQLSAQKGKKGHRARTVSETEAYDLKEQEKHLKSTERKRKRLWSQGSGTEDSDATVSQKKMKLQGTKEKEVHKEKTDQKNLSEEEDQKKVVLNQDCKIQTKESLKRKTQDDDKEVEEKKKKTSDSEQTDDNTEERKGAKKKKKRKKRNKDDKKNLANLKVIPKKEWLELRNEYIKHQKDSMKNLKASLRKMKENLEEVKKAENMNVLVTKKSTNNLEFIPDVIVFVKSETAIERKKLKEDLSTYGEVTYIDVVDGDSTAHVRCPNPLSASSIAKASICDLEFSILQGDEEKIYWDKIIKDREAKFMNKSRTKKRGKEKTISKVAVMREALSKNTHVFFDDA